MLGKKTIVFLLLFISCLTPFIPVAEVYCENSSSSSSEESDDVIPEPYTDDEFPQWSKDLRRAEIVSLGAIPFAAISVTLAYGGYQYATGKTNSFPNPLSRDNSYSKEEIFKLVGVSAGLGLSVGIIDFAINYSKRKKAEKERLLEESIQNENIRKITPEEAGSLLKKSNENEETREQKDSENQNVSVQNDTSVENDSKE
ncbi:MAG: hypothetical protein K6G00_13175 [Treponema sp.]|nr:hypothetical protein [Treponema sp.]